MLESRHFKEVVLTFRSYAQNAVSTFIRNRASPFQHVHQLSANNRRRKDIFRLPQADVELIRGLRYREKLENVDRAILENAHFLLRIVENPEIFGHDIDLEDYTSDGGREQHAQDAPLHTHDHEHARMTGKYCCPDQILMKNSKSRFVGVNHSHSHTQPHGHSHPEGHSAPKKFRPSESNMDKLRSTLKQLVRDWSVEVCCRVSPTRSTTNFCVHRENTREMPATNP